MFTLIFSVFLHNIPAHAGDLALPAPERVEYLRPCEGALADAAHLVALPRDGAEMRQLLIDFGALRSAEFQAALGLALDELGIGRDTVPTRKIWMKALRRAKKAAPALARLTLDRLGDVATTPGRRERLTDLGRAVTTAGRREDVLGIMADGVRETLDRAVAVHRAWRIDAGTELAIGGTMSLIFFGGIPLSLWQFDALPWQAHSLFYAGRDFIPHMGAIFRTWGGVVLPVVPAALFTGVASSVHRNVKPLYRPPNDGTPSLLEAMEVGPATPLAMADRAAELNPVELVYLGRDELRRITDAVADVTTRWTALRERWTALAPNVAAGGVPVAAVASLRNDVIELVRPLRERRASLRGEIIGFADARRRLASFGGGGGGGDDQPLVAAKRALAAAKVDADLAPPAVPDFVVGLEDRQAAFERELTRLAALLSDLELATPALAAEAGAAVTGQVDAVQARFLAPVVEQD